MDRINLATTESPEIKFTRIYGSLRIKGWDRFELRADSDESDTLNINSSDNLIQVECKSGCMVRLPMESAVSIGQVDRELMLKSIECPIEVGQVSGQIMAKSISQLKIEKVSSNLNAKNVEGNLTADMVMGNVNLQDVEGAITLDEVLGNLVIKGFSSSINANAHGNATLRIDPETGGKYHVTAKGNISCRLSPDVNAKISMKSSSNQIVTNISGSTETIRVKEHEIIIGDGESIIKLEAAGVINLTVPIQDDVEWSHEFDFEEDISAVADDISQIVSEQIEAQLESLTDNLSHLTSNLSNLGEFASEKNRKKLENKRIQLERKLARVERRAAEKARMANRRAIAATRRFSKQKSTTDPVSDLERQKVLEMLQNKKISVQEAELLLAAMEGRNPDLPQDQKSTSEDLE